MLRGKDTIGVVEQTVWGTPVTTGHTSISSAADPTWTYNSGDFKSQRQRYSTADNIANKGNYSYDVTIPTELEASQGIFFLKNLLGNYAFAADTPVASANTHTIKEYTAVVAEANQLFKLGFTTEIGQDANFYTFEDCIVKSYEITETEQGAFPVTVELSASDMTEDTTSNVTFSEDDVSQVFNTLQVVLSAGVDASEVAQPISLTSLRIERGGINPKYKLSSNVAKRWVQDGMLTVAGTFEIEVDDTEYAAVLDDFNNSDKASVLMVFTSDQMVTGSTPYSLTFDMSECKYTAKEGSTDGSCRNIKFSFEAGIDAAANIITISAVNGEATL